MGLIDLFTNFSDDSEDENLDYLTDEEKELVDSGEYDQWDFEYPEDSDEMDEDDYYSEDNE